MIQWQQARALYRWTALRMCSLIRWSLDYSLRVVGTWEEGPDGMLKCNWGIEMYKHTNTIELRSNYTDISLCAIVLLCAWHAAYTAYTVVFLEYMQ